jgi:hypothetical protein
MNEIENVKKLCGGTSDGIHILRWNLCVPVVDGWNGWNLPNVYNLLITIFLRIFFFIFY